MQNQYELHWAYLAYSNYVSTYYVNVVLLILDRFLQKYSLVIKTRGAFSRNYGAMLEEGFLYVYAQPIIWKQALEPRMEWEITAT